METALGQQRIAPQVEVDDDLIASFVDGRAYFEEVFPFDPDEGGAGSNLVDDMKSNISDVMAVDPTIVIEQRFLEWAAGAGGVDLASAAIRQRLPPPTGENISAIVARYSALSRGSLAGFINIPGKGLLTSVAEFWAGVEQCVPQDFTSLSEGVMGEVVHFLNKNTITF